MGLNYGILDYWVTGLHRLSGIPNSTHSRNQICSTLWWEGGIAPTRYGRLERNKLNHCTNGPLIISKIYCFGQYMTKYRNPATLLNEVRRNSVYRKKCQVQSCWPNKSCTLHDRQIRWSKFILKLAHGKKISPPVRYKLYRSLKHICRMYHIKHNTTLETVYFIFMF